MKIYWTKINKIVDETPEVKTYLLDVPEGFTWEEGAHTHFALEGFNAGEKPDKGLVRHMSISTLPNEFTIGITTRIKEQCSRFKGILRNLEVGSKVALFKTHSNVPLQRDNKNVYLLSAGVGLATFRPLILDYLERPDHIPHMHSLNIDSSEDYLFPSMFESAPKTQLSADFVANRKDYYAEVNKLAADKDGIFYVVGSDAFLVENIEVLREAGVRPEQIILDKHKKQMENFLPVQLI